MPQISILDNHPFSIMSQSNPDSARKRNRKKHTNEMVFLIRARAGFTNALWAHSQSCLAATHAPHSVGSSTGLDAQHVEAHPVHALSSRGSRQHYEHPQSFKVLIDGPYGNPTRYAHRIYDTVICVAGGSGITAVLPWLLDFSQRMHTKSQPSCLFSEKPQGSVKKTCLTRKVYLFWMIRCEDYIDWVRNEIAEALETVAEIQDFTMEINIYVTTKPGLIFQCGFSSDQN